MEQTIHTDAVIIGAGPVGLFAAFQFGLQGIKTHLVDGLESPGGQCHQLYPDKPIYDIPGLPYCTGAELSNRLLAQIRPFQQVIHQGEEVVGLACLGQSAGKAPESGSQKINDAARNPQLEPTFRLETSSGRIFFCSVVVIAAGVGAFRPRKLTIAGAEGLEGRGLFYRAEDAAFSGQKIILYVGAGADDALARAVRLSEIGAEVTILYRRTELEGNPDVLAKVRRAEQKGKLRLLAGQPIAVRETITEANRSIGVQVLRSDEHEETWMGDALLVQQGLSPKLGPIADWGLAMEKKQLLVDPATCQTNVAGIFAVGDINHYRGKKKLIVCGFHEATMAAFAAGHFLSREHSAMPLQYTTTSRHLQRLLGVGP